MQTLIASVWLCALTRSADAKPPSNMLFICKLNPVTSEEDLEIIFSRFGNVTSCDIIRDAKTGESLNYGFLGFDS